MKRHTLVVVLISSFLFSHCAKKSLPANSSALDSAATVARVEVQCPPPVTPVPTNPAPEEKPATPPTVLIDYWGERVVHNTKDPMPPENLPTADLPLAVQSCGDSNGAGPEFYGNIMPGFVIAIDCDLKIVRFRSRDYQVNEVSPITTNGDISASLRYITRLANDHQGNTNCWARLLGKISGNVQCSKDPNHTRATLTSNWQFDPTISEIMDKPDPGLEDLRNGKQCAVFEQNCFFSAQGTIGCHGGL